MQGALEDAVTTEQEAGGHERGGSWCQRPARPSGLLVSGICAPGHQARTAANTP